ncbi:N-6 DNA methylase [Candidatus Poriferisodalis sp.]|uniref:N-6 DNA methylase n=1 Tax=Candidatus Poriferisodalis sp. TaxID=3101277 RepID=UPI003D117BA8
MARTTELSADDSRFVELARQLLHWHGAAAHEDNIRSAVRSFLVETGLTDPYEVQSEASPDPQRITRRRVDLVLSDAFIEVKTRIGRAADALTPAIEHVAQLDGYLSVSPDVSVGVLTDGRHWLRRTAGQVDVPATYPWAFTLRGPDEGVELYRWLNEYIFSGERAKPVHASTVGREFGPGSPVYTTHIELIRRLFEHHGEDRTVAIKYDLWQELLAVALGEIIGTEPAESLHSLFVRHTYLVSMIGMITQATFGVDIERLSAHDPADLLLGRRFSADTGLAGVIESNFFAWLAEVDGGVDVIREMAAWVASYDWSSAELGLASALYQSVIPASEREQLGEYYTPDWLAEAMVRQAVTDPLTHRVLDPACGSGSFLVAAIRHLLVAADRAGLTPAETLAKLRRNVIGVDVHPVAVHLARSEWVLASRDAIADAANRPEFAPPVYLGDSLQMITRAEGMLGQVEVSIPVTGDPLRRELRFPRSLIERPEMFDAAMERVAAQVRTDGDSRQALVDAGIPTDERRALEPTLDLLNNLHAEGRDHIWSYYTRNVVRPLVLAEESVDVVIGNPPWITYNQTIDRLGARLKQLSVGYGIWEGAQFATNADLAALFFTRCADLYLAPGGVCAMVMPHSALAQGQYAKWRTGRWMGSDAPLNMNLAHSTPWDLEPLEANNFFPVPACVVYGSRMESSSPLPSEVEQWIGEAGSVDVERSVSRLILDEGFQSPYAGRVRNGATIFPRRLFFVEEAPLVGPVAAAGTIRVSPHRELPGREPWHSLDFAEITQQTVESKYLFDVALGASIAPYFHLRTFPALLPIASQEGFEWLPSDPTRLDPASLSPRMRERWAFLSDVWEQRRAMTLARRLDYVHALSAQLEWRRTIDRDNAIRVIYASSGHPTAAVCDDPDVIVENSLYWMPVGTNEEAHYVCGIINSVALRELVAPLMPKGQFGVRHLHTHLWKLPIPSYDGGRTAHVELAQAAAEAAAGVERRIGSECQHRGVDVLTVTTARRTAREWLASSAEGAAVEHAVRGVLDGASR